MAGDFDIGPADYEADMNGKGDTPRPMTIDLKEFARKWNAVFPNTMRVEEIDDGTTALVMGPQLLDKEKPRETLGNPEE